MSSGSKFLGSWCCDGIESVVRIDGMLRSIAEQEQRMVFDILADNDVTECEEKTKLNSIISRLTFRARFNPHRYYEIYSVDFVDEYDENDIYDMFDEMPQQMANLVRENGVMIHSDRRSPSASVII